MMIGSTPLPKADALGQYRVVTPLLNLPFLLLMVASLIPNASRSWRWTLLGACCLGVCFHLYFFYWTAAIPALVASGLIASSRAGFNLPFLRKPEDGRLKPALRGFWATGLVLAGGVAVGLPQVIGNARTFSNPEVRPILERMGRGRVLDRHDPVRTRYLGNAWAWGKLILGGAAIVAFRLRGLGLVWWLTFSGFAMANSALVTGLEFENFHWVYVHAPMGEILILVIAARLLDRWNTGRAIRNGLFWVVPVVLLAVAGCWRPYEALHAPEATELTLMLDDLRGLEPTLAMLGPDQSLSGHSWSRVAVLFSRAGLLYQEPHSYLSSVLTEESVHERHALNAWLSGTDLEFYRLMNEDYPFLVVPSGDTSRWSPEAATRRRVQIFREVERDHGTRLLDRYHPDAVLEWMGVRPPAGSGPWRPLGQSGRWQILIHDQDRPNPPAQEKIDSTKASASNG